MLDNDRPDTRVPGPQVEAPISHLTDPRSAGLGSDRWPIVPYGRWGAVYRASRLTAAVLPECEEPCL
ncbi:hypothetical protein GCM10018779_39910 [Streptomyces griseocarneus]|nr:hypothetical protein GCM10018779_39910 [Streptomyces griseocarneus]